MMMMVVRLMGHQNPYGYDDISSSVMNSTLVHLSNNMTRSIISGINLTDHTNINRWLRAACNTCSCKWGQVDDLYLHTRVRLMRMWWMMLI